MIQIAASTKVRGRRWAASVEAAKRKVKDDEQYLIRRHGAYFRPDAHGYTDHLAAAGTFAGADARRYLDVEGLSVVPLRSMRETISTQIAEAEYAAVRLKELLEKASS